MFMVRGPRRRATEAPITFGYNPHRTAITLRTYDRVARELGPCHFGHDSAGSS